MENPPGQTLVNSPPKVNSQVKIYCSYGGRLGIRACDPNDIRYYGGESKILTVDRNIKFEELFAKLSAEFNTTEPFIVRYHLHYLDMWTLIVVTNDDDVEMMMDEHKVRFDHPNRLPRIRMYLFRSKIESKPELVFGFDDEDFGSGFWSGSSNDSVVKEDDQTVEQPKSAGSDTLAPPIQPEQSTASDQAPPEVAPALDLCQIPGMMDPKLSGSSFGSPVSVNETDNNGTIGTKIELRISGEGHVTGGACVSVPESGGEKSSGSADNATNVELNISSEGGEKSSGSGDNESDDKGKNVELQNQCEGNVSVGACVYGVPVAAMSGGQPGFYVPAAVYSFVPATVAMVPAISIGSEENEEVNGEPKTD